MKKRGLSHVEMILSFVIFVSAIGFALYFFNPADSSRLVESTLTYAYLEIIENASVKLESSSVRVINSVDTLGTANYNDILPIKFSGISSTYYNIRVENLAGEELPSKIGPGDLVYVENPSGWPAEDFIFVKFSTDFTPHVSPPAGSPGLNLSLYEIASSPPIQKVISEKKFKELNDSYYADYYGLKGDGKFNLPDRTDFGFSLVFSETDFIRAENAVPGQLDVFSREERLEVLREDGTFSYADLIIKIW